jgi:CO/xanthine dehydrogenase Mo-binding subunit
MAKTIRQSLRGQSDFVSDVYIKGMLYGATVRAPFPHGRIIRVDTADLPESITVVTARDIPGENELRINGESMPILASGVCRYVGEPVALLAGPSQQAVVAAAQGLVVEYEELAPVLEMTGGAQDSEYVCRRGNVNQALSRCAEVVQGTYRTGIQEHMYNEPQGAVAEVTAEGPFVRCATQWPYHVRDTVAACLGTRPADCTVSATDTGVDLDGKLWYPSLVAAHAALLAAKSGRPVKLVFSNLEDFQYTPKRAPFTVTHLTGLDSDGAIIAARVEIDLNSGAYPLFTRETVDRLTATALALYSCPDLDVTVRAHVSNLPPLNSLRGFGSAATHFAMETHASRLAELAAADPADWRLGQLERVDARASGRAAERVMSGVRSVVESSDFTRKFAAYELQKKRRDGAPALEGMTRGIGIAVAIQGSGFAGANEAEYSSAVSVRLEADATAVVRTSIRPGESLQAYWISLVAEGLGLDATKVRVVSGPTGEVPDSGPATLSRAIEIVGKLIQQACATIQRRRFRSPLPIEVKRSYRLPRSAAWNAETLTGDPFTHSSVGAVVVEVSVDPVSFESRVDNVWLSVDAGRIVDEDQARRSLEMSIYQALEWSTHENIEYRNGAIDRRSYLSYRNTSDPLLPGLHITLLPGKASAPHGIDSLPYNCLPAALAAAISQATGRYMDRIPMDPELIHGYLENE